MFKKPQIVGIMFTIAVFALIVTGIKSPVTGANFEALTEEEATARWMTSGHADSASEAFRHWDDVDDPSANVSGSCARCHDASGAVDFFTTGATAGTYPAVDDIGIECKVCHTNAATGANRPMASVTFPSGAVIEDLGNEAICMQCHQARSSNKTVSGYIDAAIAAATGAFDDDTISSKLRFSNSHYAVAGATNMGTDAQGGAEYPGQNYDIRFDHVDGYNTCSTCHDPHTLEIRLDHCSTCHTDAGNSSYWGGVADPKNIRYFASWNTDYDGDGNTTEGLYYEIDTLKNTLWNKISAYALKVAGIGIVHGSGYPYYFKDTNGNGVADPSEQERANAFSAFTVRLTRALYNYQFVSQDHGGYAHGGKYQIQLLVDGINDLNPGLGVTGNLARDDEGHFNGSSGTWRRTSSSCVKCHTATGLPDFLDDGLINRVDADGEDFPHTQTNGLLCTTCHTSPPALRSVPSVTAPNGAVLDLGDSSNLCLNCHTGRRGMADVHDELNDDPPWSPPSIHYYPAGAILYGTEVKGGYEFPGKNYMGLNTFPNHNGRFNTCVQCHMSSVGLYDGAPKVQTNHYVKKPNPADCVGCHGFDVSQPNPGMDPAKFEFSGIRPGSIPDFDGDGNTSESMEDEILGLEAAVTAQMGIVMNTPLVFYHGRYYGDLNNNGIMDGDEDDRSNRTSYTTHATLKAAYNMRLLYSEPHAYIHNPFYLAQLLVDTIEHLGGSIKAYTWR
ncbi:MAG: hypothetical protein V3R68_02300 [Gammaproteobacteria bacterium]